MYLQSIMKNYVYMHTRYERWRFYQKFL